MYRASHMQTQRYNDFHRRIRASCQAGILARRRTHVLSMRTSGLSSIKIPRAHETEMMSLDDVIHTHSDNVCSISTADRLGHWRIQCQASACRRILADSRGPRERTLPIRSFLQRSALRIITSSTTAALAAESTFGLLKSLTSPLLSHHWNSLIPLFHHPLVNPVCHRPVFHPHRHLINMTLRLLCRLHSRRLWSGISVTTSPSCTCTRCAWLRSLRCSAAWARMASALIWHRRPWRGRRQGLVACCSCGLRCSPLFAC